MQNLKTLIAKLVGYVAICSWLTLIIFMILYFILSRFLLSLEILGISIAIAITTIITKIKIN